MQEKMQFVTNAVEEVAYRHVGCVKKRYIITFVLKYICFMYGKLTYVVLFWLFLSKIKFIIFLRCLFLLTRSTCKITDEKKIYIFCYNINLLRLQQ